MFSKVAARQLTARAFSAAAHQPPIKLHGIHARYANAAYVAASKQGVLDTVSAELQGLLAATEKHPGLKNLLDNPVVSRDDKVGWFLDSNANAAQIFLYFP